MLGYLNFGWKQKMSRWSINFDQLLISDDVDCSAFVVSPFHRRTFEDCPCEVTSIMSLMKLFSQLRETLALLTRCTTLRRLMSMRERGRMGQLNQ